MILGSRVYCHPFLISISLQKSLTTQFIKDIKDWANNKATIDTSRTRDFPKTLAQKSA